MGLCRRDKLVAEPNCGLKCKPDNEPFYCCNASQCVTHKGHYTEAEKARFTEAELAEIEKLYDGATGFLGPEGCRLPRRLRSDACLEFNCHLIVRAN